MPLARYFFYVGGVLLALLFVPYAYLPKAPLAERANANVPVIRIHSERNWPERIVFDTSLPTIIPPRIASDEAGIPSPPAATDVSVKAREREALARMQPSDAKEPQPSSPKKRQPRLQTPGQDCQETHRAAILPGRAATAIWLVWQQHLVRRLIGRACKALNDLRTHHRGSGISKIRAQQKAPVETGTLLNLVQRILDSNHIGQ